MTYDDIFRRFHLLVKEAASDWYIQNRTSFMNWNELKSGLIAQFTTPLNKFMQTQKLAQRRQGKEESASEYVNSVVRDFDSMCVYDEDEKIPIVINGLKPEYRNRAMSREWQSVQELNVFLRQLEVADELYELGNKKFVPQKFIPRRTVNSLDTVGESEGTEECDGEPGDMDTGEEAQISAVNGRYSKKPSARNVPSGHRPDKAEIRPARETNSKKPACFNCGSDSHLFRDCNVPIKGIFCFVCGAKDVLSPNCSHGKGIESKNSMNVACTTAVQSDEAMSQE